MKNNQAIQLYLEHQIIDRKGKVNNINNNKDGTSEIKKAIRMLEIVTMIACVLFCLLYLIDMIWRNIKIILFCLCFFPYGYFIPRGPTRQFYDGVKEDPEKRRRQRAWKIYMGADLYRGLHGQQYPIWYRRY